MFAKKKESRRNNNLEKSYTEKKLDMNLQAGQCLQGVHLMEKKINMIITEEKICVKTV